MNNLSFGRWAAVIVLVGIYTKWMVEGFLAKEELANMGLFIWTYIGPLHVASALSLLLIHKIRSIVLRILIIIYFFISIYCLLFSIMEPPLSYLFQSFIYVHTPTAYEIIGTIITTIRDVSVFASFVWLFLGCIIGVISLIHILVTKE